MSFEFLQDGSALPEEATIFFELGLPGFEDKHTFVLLDLQGELPIKLLQSLDEKEVSFLVANPFYFYSEYEWNLPDHVQKELSLSKPEEVEILAILTIPEDASLATINLLAPLVINRTKRLGKQHILHDSNYGSRHPLLRIQEQSGLEE